ncbi:CoA-binding protein (plasmid) [Nostoc sp. NIES-3756]|uniref:CoA-binding protein n=1 Tax=Nostoc sp. NIES-3756 TaxID=1751286 RepID=UPI0007200F36|nr:CoA-binding protein [Nostoc sp. NIES-3756]BAT56655.1 CoA-binding protein [Nostoc sp. NIES-3756]BAY41675.1 CoA-binding protein [Nostoc sp. NIES-2111]
MPLLIRNDNTMRDVLTYAKVIAVVGHSDKPERTSYQIAQFLLSVGYTVYPVNPTVKEIDGQLSYSSLQEIPETIDIVNIFRRSEYLSEVVEQAISINAKTIWGQLGVSNQQAAQKALLSGLNVMMNACIKVEYLRLGIG